jgi:hypothetical protein
MENYIPPNLNKLSFTFSAEGYSSPEFKDISFDFSLKEANSTATLQASISVIQLYQDSTYTYTKNCRTIVVGYSATGIQTLQLKCDLAGIRDVGAFIYPNLRYLDLTATIQSVNRLLDLKAYVKATFKSNADLYSYLRGKVAAFYDLNAFLVGDYISADLYAYVDVVSIYNLITTIFPELLKGNSSLSSYIKVNQRYHASLASILNIIEISDLNTYLNSIYFKGSLTLSSYTRCNQSNFLNFNSTLHGWDLINLNGSIDQVYQANLRGRILSTLKLDIKASVKPILPINISATLWGYAKLDLSSYILGGYGPTDLVTYIYVVAPKNLYAKINSYRGLKVIKDLNCYLLGTLSRDLRAFIEAGKFDLLYANIVATGSYKDLTCWLYPKKVHVKKMFNISLLKVAELKAFINTSCYFTNYKNLKATLYSYNSKALWAYIVSGEAQGGDLHATINAYTVVVEDSIQVFLAPYNNSNTVLVDGYSTKAGTTFDTIEVLFSYNKVKSYNTLKAYMYATKFKPAYKDIEALVLCTTDKSYDSLTTYNKMFTILTLSYDSRVVWQREIELAFGAYAQKYNYFKGTGKTYKVDPSRQWVIRIEGFNYVKGIGVDRGKVKRRYIFDLSKYKDVDEAIRDAIDRVSTFSRCNLKAALNGIISKHPYKQLSSYIYAIYSNRISNLLNASIKGIASSYISLNAKAYGEQPLLNLNAIIQGDYYVAPNGNKVDFNFTEDDKVDWVEGDVDLNFESGL